MGGCPTRRCSRRRLRRFPRLDKNARLGPAERRAVAYKIVATAHLISGLPCSGKTTYSKALGGDLNSVHFALDYWLITAVGAYTMESVGDEEHVRRVLACRKLIWRNAVLLLVRGVETAATCASSGLRPRTRCSGISTPARASWEWRRWTQSSGRRRMQTRRSRISVSCRARQPPELISWALNLAVKSPRTYWAVETASL
jgi:hypothetical protein